MRRFAMVESGPSPLGAAPRAAEARQSRRARKRGRWLPDDRVGEGHRRRFRGHAPGALPHTGRTPRSVPANIRARHRCPTSSAALCGRSPGERCKSLLTNSRAPARHGQAAPERLRSVLGQHDHELVVAKRRSAREHLVQDDAYGVEVGAVIDRLAARLLRQMYSGVPITVLSRVSA